MSRSGEADNAQELLLQERLQILLERLRWSYAALWTLNPLNRLLQWKRGYYSSQADSSKAAEKPKPGWYAPLFYTTYSSCSFSLGTGFVGRANLEGRYIWLSGDSVCQNAGSLEQSQFLSYANVKTVMCIPWLDSVLELGTTNYVGENFQLMDQIQQVLSHDLLSVPSLRDEDVAASLQQHQSTVESVLELPDAALNQPGGSGSGSLIQSPFDINMSDQVWRADMMNNFMQPEPDRTTTTSTLPELAAAWRVIEKQHKNDSITITASTSHGLMSGADQYVRSRTSSYAGTSAAASLHAAVATASSSTTSVSSHGDQYSNSSTATRAGKSVSPELLPQHFIHALSPNPNVSVSVSRSTPPDRTSSTARLPQPGEAHNLAAAAYSTIKQEQDRTTEPRTNTFDLRRTTSCSDQYEIQRALSLFETQDQWPHQHGLNPVSEENIINVDANVTAHDIWKQYDDSSVLSNQNDIRKVQSSGKLRRRHTLAAPEVLKEVETYQQEADNSNMVDQGFFPEQAQVSPAQAQMNSGAANLRGHPRAPSSRGLGVAPGHDKAAMNHMMAERRRRVKQKENFATLRKLVPIISKADKASTLVDAIVYLKDLQNTISEMKANEDEMVQRCADLASKCSKLEEQNKELVAMLTKDRSPGEGIHLNNQLCLHST